MPVSAMAFSPDGRWLSSGSTDGTVKLWELASGREFSTLSGHTGPVSSVAFSPDGRWLASGSVDQTVKLWDLASGRELRTFSGHTREVWSVAFSPDGRWLASGSGDDTVKLWELATGRERRTLSGHTGAVSSVAFSPDGRWLASGSRDRTVKLWELASGRELRTLSGHTSPVRSVAFSPDGHWLASGTISGGTLIWDLASGELTASLVPVKDGTDWLVVTPEGLFDGSEQGMQKLVAWRIGNRVYPPDKFFADFYTPGLLARIFAGERPKPAIDMASLKLPPDVRITSPGGSVNLKEERVSVSVQADDLGGGVAEVRLYQNGKLVGSRGGARGATSNYSFEVGLVLGENILKATAFTSERFESNEDTVRLVYEAPQPAQPVLHLLVVGVNQYEDQTFNLGFARQDGEALARFFEQRGARLFRAVNTTRLFDADATQQNIRAALEKLATQARREDVVLVYLAGHGVGLGQQFYFLPHEMRTEIDQEEAIRKYGIPAPALGEALHKIPALKQVLLLDTCQSETALPILAKVVMLRGMGLSAVQSKAAQMLARAIGVYLIAASTKQQFAYEVPELGHGVLTYALLSGLGEKAAPLAPTTGDGIVTIFSLLQYVSQRVPDLTEKYHSGSKQYPVVSSTGMDFPLVIR